MKQKLTAFFNERRLYALSIAIIVLGITLRIVFYLQNRNLFIDESNVARNIFERSFAGLTQPLSYEQYAPPLFLWVIKCCTLCFGYSEYSYRLFPLICGIASLFLLFKLLKKYTNLTAAWYPLIIMATGFMYIHYSAELKQYICDTVVALLLLLAALKIDIIKTKSLQFLLLWGVIGSVTVWLSMPGVFILAGVGTYYAYIAFKEKAWNKIGLLVSVACVWLAQFAAYYFVILKPQITSDYLQNCHKDFFLYLLPNKFEQWDHNADVLVKALSAMGGKWTVPEAFHILCLMAGWVFLFRRQTTKAILITVPIIVLLLAAATHQYALTPRLILFIFPLLLTVIAVGFQQLLRVKFVAVRIVLVLVACLCFYMSNTLNLFYKRYDFEQITESMDFVKKEQINGSHLIVHNLAGPAYIYYTTINPRKEQWQNLRGATILNWNSNYDSLSLAFTARRALLYSWAPDDEIARQRAAIEKNHKQEAEQVVTGSRVYIYEGK